MEGGIHWEGNLNRKPPKDPFGTEGLPTAGASESAALDWHEGISEKKESLDALAEKYRQVQNEIRELNRSLEMGREHMSQVAEGPGKEAMLRIGAELDDKTRAALVAAEIRKKQIELEIQDSGGNPEDYIVH